MSVQLSYLYLLSPLHTGGVTQEGNLLGIARESHTELPYLPSSTIRGRLRARTESEDKTQCKELWGNSIDDLKNGDANLTQGALWVGDGALLWLPVPSISHGVIWITSPFLLKRWARFTGEKISIPAEGSFSGAINQAVYLRDAVFPANTLTVWKDWKKPYIPEGSEETRTITTALVLPDAHCKTLIESSLWRQVRVKLDQNKTVEGGFRYEEAIPPDTLMYFPWGSVVSANGKSIGARKQLQSTFDEQKIWQFGGQESLGRGLIELWSQS